MLLRIIISLLLLSSCASGDKRPDWAEGLSCFTDKMACSVNVRESTSKLFKEWEVGKRYEGHFRNFKDLENIKPIYEKVVFYSKDALFVKKHGDQGFSRYDSEKKIYIPTKINGFLKAVNPVDEKYGLNYIIGLSKDKKTAFLLNLEGKIMATITDVDSISRKSIHGINIPPVINPHDLRSAHLGVLIRHNKNGKVFYQAYSDSGKKLGKTVDFFDTYMLLSGGNYHSKGTRLRKQRLIIYRKEANFRYSPILFKGNLIWDIWDRKDGFVGIELKKHAGYVFSLKRFVFKDKVGEYYFDGLDINRHGGLAPVIDLEARINRIRKFSQGYREILPVTYMGYHYQTGKPRELTTSIYQGRDLHYEFADRNIARFGTQRRYKKLNDLKGVMTKYLAHLKTKNKKVLDSRAWDKAIAESIARNKVYNDRKRAARIKMEKEVAYRAKQSKIEKKNRKPTFQIDVEKIFDVKGAKARAECFKKSSASKRAFNSGKQGWYFSGGCN